MDDGSTDSSGNICDMFGQKDSRIKIVHKENGGLSSARNAGIRYALEVWPTTEAFYLLDADNRLRRGALSRAAAAHGERPG